MGGPCEIKGVAFYTFFQALRELRGEAAVEATRAALAPELRDPLRLGAITRVGYYPLKTYVLGLRRLGSTRCGIGYLCSC